eukprot:m.20276 g.20276  ORF g.20276 m.20276 type:complete len:565 (-) comp7784_c0_seq1:74-1768(-)
MGKGKKDAAATNGVSIKEKEPSPVTSKERAVPASLPAVKEVEGADGLPTPLLSPSDGMEDALTQLFRSQVEKTVRELHDAIEFRMRNLVDDLTPLLNSVERPNKALRPVSGNTRDLPERIQKKFVARESKLTEMFQLQEFQTIYNIFVVVLIILSLQTLYDDLFAHSHSLAKALNFELMTWAFGQVGTTSTIWCLMFLQTLAIYPLFRAWTFNRLGSSYFYSFLYLLYQVILLVWPPLLVLHYHLPPASGLIVGCEQLRLIMKSHSFVRENTPLVTRLLKLRDCTAADLQNIGLDFSHYIYFLFAPTLLYRPSYPRTPKIRWNVVVENFTHVVAALFYTYYIFSRYCVPQFQHTGIGGASFKVKTLLSATFLSMVPGTVVMLLAFFAILHSWLNAFAEMLRFADRQFYKDWWNCRSFAAYYRTWNVVVHDWLYAYVYQDLLSLGGLMKNRTTSMLTVFTFSAIMHEYVIMLGLDFIYPVLLIMFGGFGVFFIYFTKNQSSWPWNVFMWLMLFFGTGLLMCLYSHEWYARKNMCEELCPNDNPGGPCSCALFRTPLSFSHPWSWE